jgi:cobalamin synthase
MDGSNPNTSSKPLIRILVGLSLGLVTGIFLYLFHATRYDSTKSILQSLVAIIFSVVASGFMINLVLPVSSNRRGAIIVSIPTFVVLFFFFSVQPYVSYQNTPEMQKDYWYVIQVSCCGGPIIELGTTVLSAFSGWLGSCMNRRVN